MPLSAGAVRLKNIASVKGVRDNQLLGYGIVVGLDGTGDGSNAAFTTQGLANILKNMGMPVNESDLKVSNVAGVMVTAKLPPFFKSGQTIDVTISSLGDASSLQGGTLLVTPLKGLDGAVYAMAQGPISIGGFAVRGSQNNNVQRNHLTVARIPSGATVEREVPVNFAGKDTLNLSLNSPDFTTVSRMLKAINLYLGGEYAIAVDGATVKVKVPDTYQHKEIELLADLESLEVNTDALARVVIDERTGTVVMGSDVRIGELALSHGSLSVQISNNQRSAISGKLLSEKKAAMNGTTGNSKGQLINLTPGVTLGELVRALNSVGVSPSDLIAIFQTIKAAGAMQAELEII